MPARVIPGKTDLATTHPEIAKEAEGWDPTTVSFGSGKPKLWKCSLGHTYEKAPNRRTTPSFAAGCPYCAGSKILAGFNDLATFHEVIAKQADGWDPTTVSRASDQKKSWRCGLGHIWEATVKNRTLQNSGCPVCDGKKVLAGFNDLATKFPDIAKEADGWDPSLITPFSGKKRAWKCQLGHTYEKKVAARCTQSIGCPYCSGKEILKGFNDLETKFPEIAKEALDWDPSSVTPFSSKKASWICPEGHEYQSVIANRTSQGQGCPFCSGNKVLAGFNDLASTRDDIAKTAFGWDPATVTQSSLKQMKWKCPLGHIYKATVASRTRIPNGTNCPYCSGNKVLKGFNDLATKFPLIAEEADGWDPQKVSVGSSTKIRDWKCKSCGFKWSTTVNSRTGQGAGCPECAEGGGYKTSLQGWFYLMMRPGEQQFGISNFIETRIKQHEKNGWSKIEVVGPFDGELVWQTEADLKKWLRKEIGLISGSSENWRTTSMEVKSLAELKKISGIETNIF